MRRLFLVLIMLIFSIGVRAQTITLSFTGQDAANHHVQLERVIITNLSQNWQETLYWPDTTLTLNNGVGINDNEDPVGFKLYQNNPNPFNGITDASLTVVDAGSVALEITDVNGRAIENRNYASLPAGTHHFRITLSAAGTYIMTARQNGKTSSIKMINNGSRGENSIMQLEHVVGEIIAKSGDGTKSNVTHPWAYGDNLTIMGYSTICGTECTKQFSRQLLYNETITIYFSESITTPTVAASSVSNITSNSASVSSSVSGNCGVISRGFCYGTSSNPTISGQHTSNGSGTGSFTGTLSGLTPSTTYYVRAYATNAAGTAYGSQTSFTTSTLPEPPVITTNDVTNVLYVSAICGGSITSIGTSSITACGVCWSTSHNPTLADNHTTDNISLNFTSHITGLTQENTYYVRAYATNSAGTSYGNEMSFSTLYNNPHDNQHCPGTPTVTDVDNHIYNTVQIGNQCWMKENLRTTHLADYTSISHGTFSYGNSSFPEWYYPDTHNGGSEYIFADSIYGLLYTGNAVRNAIEICPTGWHVPSYAEWRLLKDYVSSRSLYWCGNDNTYIAKALASTTGWINSSGSCAVGTVPENNNATGFSALPTGWVTFTSYPETYGQWKEYLDRGNRAYFWSSTRSGFSYSGDTLYCCELASGSKTFSISTKDTRLGYSVRCLRNEGVSSSAQLPMVNTTAVDNVTLNSATSGGTVTDDCGSTVIERGVCWSTSKKPTIADSHTTNGSGMGNFSSNITGLIQGSTYYVRAYATNSFGTAYGNEVSFIASIVPTITTYAVSNTGVSTATCGGNVDDDGGSAVTARGVCWSTSPNPTTNNNYTSDGNGIGVFISILTGLSSNATYYVRAYATNSVGTAYGNEVSFTTTAPCGIFTFTDIDGNIYNTVQIGNQCWMKENLRTTHYADSTAIPAGSTNSSTEPYRYAPDGDESYVATYGYLYNWNAVMRNFSSSSANPSVVQGVCPTGWHVPSDAEWTQLTDYVNSQSQYQCHSSNSIAKALAATTGWSSSTNTCAVGNIPSSNNATGFGVLPAGGYNFQGVGSLGIYANLWSSTESSVSQAYYHQLFYSNDAVTHFHGNKANGYSVRCVKD